jgi:hypothetical protein
MSINGIGNSNLPRPLAPAGPHGSRPPIHDRTSVQRQPADPAIASRTGVRPPSPPAANDLPVEAPAGTDPELWSILSAEERGYFAKVGAMGPLTYGRAFDQLRQQQVPAVRGGRLDVKV